MTVFVYFPHRLLQTQDWDSAAFSTTCLQSMPTAVNVSHELSLKSSQKYFTHIIDFITSGKDKSLAGQFSRPSQRPRSVKLSVK